MYESRSKTHETETCTIDKLDPGIFKNLFIFKFSIILLVSVSENSVTLS